MNFNNIIKKLCDKLKNSFYYKTSTSKLEDYTLLTVEPRFKTVRPKRKYKSRYTVVEDNSDVVIYKNEEDEF